MLLKKIGKKILQVILSIIALLVIAFLVLLIHHQVTKKAPEQYLPSDAKAYIAIDSLHDLYNDIIDLKALEIVFAQEKLNNLFYSVIDFKNADYSSTPLFKEILDLKTYIVLQENYSPALIIDPGLKGIATRHIPSFLNSIKHEDIEISTSILEGNVVYTLTVKAETSYYFIIEENLVLLALEKSDLVKMIKASKTGEGLATRDKLKKLKTTKVKDSILNLFLDTNSVLENVAEEGSSTEKLLSMVDFPSLTALSLALTNESVNIKAATDITTEEPLLTNFLGHKASPLGVINTLPDTTNIYTSVNFKSFKELYAIISTLQDGFVLEEYDSLIKGLSGLSSDDILFSWTGSEAGLFTIETAPEPVLFLEIAKEKELDRVLESLDSSLVLNVIDTLVIDDVRINQFKLPGLLEAGMSLANKSSVLPYFIKYKDYLYLSMNPEILAQMVKKDREGELLIKEKTYKSITQKTPKNANFFFYYDLNSTLPRFLAEDTLLTKLVKEYEKGVISLFYTQERVTLNLSAESSQSKRTTLYPGYPKDTNGIKSPVYITDITGKDSKELVYIDNKKNLVISDITNNQLSSTSIGQEAFITLLPNKKILVNDVDGVLYKVDGDGELVDPFPQFTEAKDSFPPLITRKGFILYSSLKKELQHYNHQGVIINSIPVTKEVFRQPLLIEDRIYFYPKSLFGNILCTNLEGETVKGWPQSTMAISFTTPFKAGKNIGFLTQKGDLFLWDKNGNIVNGFPVELPGVYYSTPIVIDDKGSLICVINKDGVLSVIDNKGEIKSTREFDQINSKDIRLKSVVLDDFKSPLIFIYGGSNYILAINDKLQILPGFPVKGYTEPSFSDINNDKLTEMITAGYDKKLYIYTLRSN